MDIRKTLLKDLDKVMRIYDSAGQYMRENGNPNQWKYGYPNMELIKEDIYEGKSYVCVDGQEIVGVFFYSDGPDPTYYNIYEGSWIKEGPYGVIHRIASASRQKGVASFCLNWAMERNSNIRIDTHEDNIIMQNFLTKNGFIRCGIIYLDDGAKRIAYQKVI